MLKRLSALAVLAAVLVLVGCGGSGDGYIEEGGCGTELNDKIVETDGSASVVLPEIIVDPPVEYVYEPIETGGVYVDSAFVTFRRVHEDMPEFRFSGYGYELVSEQAKRHVRLHEAHSDDEMVWVLYLGVGYGTG